MGWFALFATAYKVTTLTHDYVNWDPFEILQIDPGSSTKDIKKAYHKLSLIYHPDKDTGDEKRFLMITKAYAALTDDEARKNWELYGNPDGPGATSFGIALPSWIVEKENSLFVLGLYALVFMIALPTVVGVWWYNSVKYGGDEVLLDTTQLYYYLIHKTPHMMLKRIIMIIAASPEFEKSHNSEVVERPSDNFEVPALIREIPNLNEKNKERPLCFGYSIKARALIYAHLSRMKLPANSLEIDKAYIVKKCPTLIQEFVQCVAQMTMLALAGRISRSPTLDTLEAAMKLSPLVVQAVWDSKSPLLQLPHVTEDMLRYFSAKKSRQHIRSLQQLARMKDDDRRNMLKSLSDEEYEDIMVVLGNMPLIESEIKTEVLDDEDSGNITAGSIVTVTVTLTRKSLSSIFADSPSVADSTANHKSSNFSLHKNDVYGEDNPLLNGDASQEKENTQPSSSRPVWDKKGKLAKKIKKQKNQQKKLLKEQKREEEEKQLKEKEEKKKILADEEASKEEASASDIDESSGEASDKEDGRSGTESDDEAEENNGNSSYEEGDNNDSDAANDDEEEEDWERFQKKQQKKSKSSLETKGKISHSVHCPFFPDDKQEFWWIYLADKKRQALTSIPVLLTNLVDKETIELKLTAPSKPGVYQYSVVIRSDSYIDFDVVQSIKVSMSVKSVYKNICNNLFSLDLQLDVKEAKIVQQHPQWEMSDVEEEEDQEGSESAVEDSDLLDDSDDNDASS